MDILFLLLLTIIFVVQIVMLVRGIKKNKNKLIGELLVVELASIFMATFANYYFNEIQFKYAPNFDGFFQILCSSMYILLYIIMFVITSIVLVVKTAKTNKNL